MLRISIDILLRAYLGTRKRGILKGSDVSHEIEANIPYTIVKPFDGILFSIANMEVIFNNTMQLLLLL